MPKWLSLTFASFAFFPVLVQAQLPFTSVSPKFGGTTGGQVVVIFGPKVCPSGCFENETTVTFGGVPATVVRYFDDFRVYATVPPHAAGQVDVVVRRPDGVETLPSAFTYVEPSDYERILLPLMTGFSPIPGVNGSIWLSSFRVFNNNLDPLEPNRDVLHLDGRCVATCGGIPPVMVRIPDTLNIEFPLFGVPPQPPTALLFVKKPLGEKLAFSLRIQDLSRQSLTWGTEIPVIRERDLRTSPTQLLEIPMEESFRQMLRVYDADARPGSAVRIRGFRGQDGLQVYEGTLPLIVPRGSVGALTDIGASESYSNIDGSPDFPLQPGYAELQLSSIPELRENLRILRLEIEPVTPGLRFWAFVAVTNNETQHVTAITPQ